MLSLGAVQHTGSGRNTTMSRTALVIGATGGLGGEAARALALDGWTVRALHRHPEEAGRKSAWVGPVEWIRGDAMNESQVVAAAKGVDVIVHAANPPGYRNWRGLALPMLESTIAAAKASGARIVLPGTVYNFGSVTSPLVAESDPQRPETRKGAIRVAMERRLEEEAREGTPVLIVRAGDFFGGHAGNSWFSQGLVKPGRPLRAVTYPGKADVGHAWAYLPDLARAIVRLLDRSEALPPFARFHFGGHWFERGVVMAEATRQAAGAPNAPIRSFPWFAVFLLAPFHETFREMIEMRYLWTRPVRLDNRKLVEFLGDEPHTPLDEALKETLRGLGCLGDRGHPAGAAPSTV
jgi:nucleoside-diphosphate-sugar epimerase